MDFEFTQKDFAFIRKFMKEKTGIDLSESKYSMVYARLIRRLRGLGVETFSEYCQKVEHDPREQVILVNQITTNVTSFFREKHHFDKLVHTLIPMWQEKKLKQIRIWSAGCSSGQEPYTIAMVMHHHAPPTFGFEILATDLDSDILEKARKGVYPISSADEIPADYLKTYFKKGSGDNEGWFRISDTIRQKVSFEQLNFQSDWNYPGAFDLIFCRNVMIYFAHDTQERLIAKFFEALKPGGCLFLGHSESIMRFQTAFKLLDKTIYQKATHEKS